MARTLSKKGPDRDARGPNGPLAKKNGNGIKGAKSDSGPFGPAALSPWIRNVNDYHRRQPREYAVTRFG
jgi:hypothetical protein